MDFLDRIRTRAELRRRGAYLGERLGKGWCFIQGDQNIANQAGAAFRGDLNTELQALVTNSQGASAPSTTYRNQWWHDTTANVVKRRNAANSAWIVRDTLDETFVLSRSSNTILGLSDIGKTIRATSSFTQTYTAAATLGDGWWVEYINEGVGVITHDPNASETIGGQAALAFDPGQSGIIVCNGSSFQIIARSRYKGAIAAGRNIAARTDPTTPNSKANITADELQLKDGNGNVFVALSVSVTGDMAASGANGLDTGSEGASTWYYGWVIAKEDGTVAALISASSTAPTMPSGYTYKALATAVRNNGSSNFVAYRQLGNTAYYEAQQIALNAGTATTETSVSTATFVPPNALAVLTQIKAATTSVSGGEANTLNIRVISGSDYYIGALNTQAAGANLHNDAMGELPNISQNIYYLWATNQSATRSASIWVLGFKLPMGGE